MRTTVFLLAFWVSQIILQWFFAWGAGDPRRWWLAFILGNLSGLIGTAFLLKLYGYGNAGLACALGMGGSFILAQLTLALATWRSPSLGQWACIVLIAAGMSGYALLGKPATAEAERPAGAAVLPATAASSP